MNLDTERIKALKTLSARIGYPFSDLELLNKALTHRSYANERQDPKIKDNERFEFLGDSVLDLIVARYMVLNGGNLREGGLSKIRSQVVNEQSLASVAKNLDLGVYLLLGKGEEGSGGREKSSLLANGFEAVIAAVFLDSNFDTAYETFLEVLKEMIHNRIDGGETDYKGLLLRTLRGRGEGVTYRVTGESGPDHEKYFEVCAMINDEPMGIGEGRTKKEAEQKAAHQTLLTLNQSSET